MQGRPRRRPHHLLVHFGHLGLTFAFAVVAPTLCGQWLDERFGGGGLWTLAGAALGFGCGMVYLLKEVEKLDRMADEGDSEDSSE